MNTGYLGGLMLVCGGFLVLTWLVDRALDVHDQHLRRRLRNAHARNRAAREVNS